MRGGTGLSGAPRMSASARLFSKATVPLSGARPNAYGGVIEDVELPAAFATKLLKGLAMSADPIQTVAM